MNVFSVRRAFRGLGLILLCAQMLIIFYMTVASRSPGARDIALLPFYSFYEAYFQPEFYREMMMNIFLFEPLGIVMPFGVEYVYERRGPGSHQYPEQDRIVRISLLMCLGFSVMIELLQGFGGLGRAETDDIIMNMLGAAPGIACYAAAAHKYAV